MSTTTKPAKQIETKNASIDTFSVTIRALHVGGKQMTLSVFRQLPVASCYEADGRIVECLQPWGIVRYLVTGEGDTWLVASYDSTLYRCNLETQFTFHFPRLTRELARASAALTDARKYIPLIEDSAIATQEYEAEIEKLGPALDDWESSARHRASDAAIADYARKKRNIYASYDKRIRVCIPKSISASGRDETTCLKLSGTLENYEAEYESTRRQIQEIHRKEASRKTLSALPQLFIAV